MNKIQDMIQIDSDCNMFERLIDQIEYLPFYKYDNISIGATILF